MCEKSRSAGGGFLPGLVFGAIVGAGLTFIFGTQKGKEVQKSAKKKWPELAREIESFAEIILETLEEAGEETKEQVAGLASGVLDFADDLKSEAKHLTETVKEEVIERTEPLRNYLTTSIPIADDTLNDTDESDSSDSLLSDRPQKPPSVTKRSFYRRPR